MEEQKKIPRKMLMKFTYVKILGIYKLFTDVNHPNLDFSEQAKEEMYQAETFGKGCCNVDQLYLDYLLTGKKINGYAVGKRNMDITIKMWMEDLKRWGTLFLIQLYEDPEFPHWWLDKIFKNFFKKHPRAKELICKKD